MVFDVTLYVRSTKTAAGEVRFDYSNEESRLRVPMPYLPSGNKPYPYYDPRGKTKYNFVLPEDEQKMVEDVQRVASEFGLTWRVVDLTKESRFSRWRFEHSKKIQILPALITGSGEIREGIMTKEQIEGFLSNKNKSAA